MRAIILTTALTLAAAAPAVAAEPTAAAGDRSRYASIEIDTSAVGEAGPIIQRRVRERGDVVLRDAEILPARNADDSHIHVAVEELRGEEPGFLYTIWIERNGSAVGDKSQLECTLCTESEIVERIEQGLAAAATELPTAAELSASEAADATDPDPIDSDTTSDQDDLSSTQPLGGMGKAGIGLLVGGAAGVGVGVALVVRPAKLDRDDPRFETTTRPPGWAVLATGAAAAVTGAVLLGLDRSRARRARTAVAPWIAPEGGGVVASVRF